MDGPTIFAPSVRQRISFIAQFHMHYVIQPSVQPPLKETLPDQISLMSEQGKSNIAQCEALRERKDHDYRQVFRLQFMPSIWSSSYKLVGSICVLIIQIS